MKIKNKLYINYLALLAALGVVGTVAGWSAQSWRAAFEEQRAAWAHAQQAERLRGTILRQVKEILDAFVTLDPDAGEEIDLIRAEVETLMTDMRRWNSAPPATEGIDALYGTYRAITDLGLRVVADLRSGRVGPAREKIEQDFEQVLFPRLEAQLGRLKTFYETQAARSMERALWRHRWVQLLTVVAIVACIGQGLVLFRGIQRWLIRPIQAIGRSTEVISTGDLTHRVPVQTSDELGELAAAINRMAASLQAIQERLVRSERWAAVGELSSYVAHNIRNPLASIRSAAQVGLEDLERGDVGSVREGFQDIIQVVDRLERWTRHLLDLTRPVVLRPSRGDVNSLLREVVACLRPKGAAKGLRWVLDLDESLPPRYLDWEQTEQALIALVVNAVDASRPGGTIRVASSPTPGGGVLIVVQDTGVGMSEEVRRRAFEPYFTTKPDGVGMGLPMAKRVVEAHGGTINIVSQEGVGTTVTVYLPGEGDDDSGPHRR
ncbi:MAG: ATP-binding protein [Acidobacteria bacterium]|nr:ATP-binding protein [Acidobacteriota bacterium]MDW7983347.1 ATP-binding protein [Acidobacteriota bacterium]